MGESNVHRLAMAKGFGEPRREDIEELVAAFEATVAGQATVYLDQSAFLDIIDHYLAQGKLAAAMSACQQALLHFHYSSDFHLRQAQLLARERRYAEAHAALDKGETYSPNDPELIMCRAEIFIMEGKTEQGLSTLATLQAEADAELLADIFTIESLAYEYQANFKQAFEALKAALQALPTHEEALERFANCMVLSRQYEEAVPIFQLVIDENPYSWRAWYYLGEATSYLNQDYEALEAYEYAFIIKEDFEDAYFEYAELCYNNQLYEKALETYQEMGDRFTVDSLLLQRQGACYQALEQYETARQCLQKAARLEPHNDEVIYQIGVCYGAQEKWDKAYAFYRKAIRMEAEREDYHSALAKAAFELNKIEEAELAYREALLLGPDNCDTWLDLAWFLLEMLRAEEALTVLREANEALLEAELKYSYIAVLIVTGHRQKGLLILGETLADFFSEHSYLFDWLPELRRDKDVLGLIELYRG